MKKGIQIILFTIIFLGGIGMLVNYFFTKRRVQEHAQCIPANAFMVVTLNVKQLAMAQFSEKKSLDKISKSNLFSKELKPFLDAIKTSGSMEDALIFMHQSGEAAFIGITLSANDLTPKYYFEDLVKDGILKDKYVAFQHNGNEVFQIDTSSFIIGHNAKCLLLLYPFGNSTADETSDECLKLLSQTKEKSILSNENFCKEQLNAFDANIWIHASPLLTFSGGGSFFKTQLDGVDYLNMNVEFRNGEIDIRKIVTTDGKENKIPKNLIITGDPQNVLGFIRVPMNFENKNMMNAYLRSSPLSNVPLSDEELQKLLTTFNGNCSILFHDTISYEKHFFIETLYSHYPDSATVYYKKHTTAMSYCFGLKDEAAAKKIFTEIAFRDSFPFSNSSWTFNGDFSSDEPPTKFFINDNVFTMTTDLNSDGKPRTVPDQWDGMDLQLNLGDYFNDSENSDLYFFLPNPETSRKILADNFSAMTISQPTTEANKQSSTVIIRMKDKKINALIQLEDMMEKIMLGE